ncbi:MAG: type III-A CRISPR-associated RAMP protein Csm5 [Saprospiraceae bacterium]
MNITTLTPTHVGSGEKPMREVDFLLFGEQVAMLDPEKVLGIIGTEQVNQWVACVDAQSGLRELLEKRKPDLVPADVALRTLPVQHRGMGQKADLHEQLHDGMGRPLLPGSSLKGAVRTALFAHFINRNDGDDAKTLSNLLDRRNAFSDSFLSRKYFGDDPNHDMLRLLRVGDATFQNTACAKAETINLKGKEWIVDDRFTQFIEVIPQGETAALAFQFDAVTERNAREKGYFKTDTAVLQQPKLFSLINHHTRNLAERELEHWKKEDEPDELGCYVEVLQNMVEATRQCAPNECVIRLGWGSGFRNMTGDWHIQMTDDDYYELLRKLRPRHPEDMVYPKSFRVLADGTPLGFVKLATA